MVARTREINSKRHFLAQFPNNSLFLRSSPTKGMVEKKKFGERIVALWLFALLLLPLAVEFAHSFEEHEGTSCSETTSHIHNLEAECELCDIRLTTFDFNIITAQELVVTNTPVKMEANDASSQLHSFQITNIQLRAPPVDS